MRHHVPVAAWQALLSPTIVPGRRVRTSGGKTSGGHQAAWSGSVRRCADPYRGNGFGSPLLSRANVSRNGPAAMCHRWPAGPIASSDSVRGDRPDSAAAMMAGPASSVVKNLPMILVDGMSRSWYSTATSRQTSVFPGGLPVAPADLGLAPVESAHIRDEKVVVRVDLGRHVVRVKRIRCTVSASSKATPCFRMF